MISVIIPTLNESGRLPALLACLLRCATEHEVIVCDGGSSDNTVGIAEAHGALVVTAKIGRGNQLAAGARHARGDVLFFLHADSELDPRCLAEIELLFKARPDVVGGNFRVEYIDSSMYCRAVEWLCQALRIVGIYYGDSGIFVRRSAYEAIGGFRLLAIMEDFDFVRRLERFGKTQCIKKVPIRSSTRRFKRKHPLELLFMWIKMHVLFAFGVGDNDLAVIYDAQGTEVATKPARVPEE